MFSRRTFDCFPLLLTHRADNNNLVAVEVFSVLAYRSFPRLESSFFHRKFRSRRYSSSSWPRSAKLLKLFILDHLKAFLACLSSDPILWALIASLLLYLDSTAYSLVLKYAITEPVRLVLRSGKDLQWTYKFQIIIMKLRCNIKSLV